MKIRFSNISLIAAVAAAVFAGAGCPTAPTDGPAAQVTILLTAGNGLGAASSSIEKARVVRPEEVARLDVDVEEILLLRESEAGPVFESALSAPATLNLVDLIGVSQVLDTAQIPLGTYTSAQLVFSAARLYLATEPTVAISNVSFFDNGRINVPVSFTVEEDTADTIVFDLGGINLTALDDGSYVLTPDVAVSLPQEPVPAQFIGNIASLDLANERLVLSRRSAEIEVNFAGAVIFRRDDFDTPTGLPNILRVGHEYLAIGSLNFDGTLNAQVLVQIDDDYFDDSEGEGEGDDDHGGEGEGEGDDSEGEGEGDDDRGGHGEGEDEGDDDHGGDDDDDDDDDDNSGHGGDDDNDDDDDDK